MATTCSTLDYAGKWVDQDSIRQPLTPELIAKAEYRVQSGLIELSSNKVDTEGFAIDIAGITVGFSPRRQDSSVLLNNKYLPMIAHGVYESTRFFKRLSGKDL